MAKKITAKTDNDTLYNADQAVRSFCDEHPGDLSETEHQELRGLLSNRADALSEALGVKVSSLFDD